MFTICSLSRLEDYIEAILNSLKLFKFKGQISIKNPMSISQKIGSWASFYKIQSYEPLHKHGYIMKPSFKQIL